MQQSKRTPKVIKTLSAFSVIRLEGFSIFLLEPVKNHAKFSFSDRTGEREANTYRGASDLTSFVLVKLWSKISAKSEIVQNTEK